LDSLPKFEKNFYRENEKVTNRSSSEIEEFRRKHEVTVQGKNIPRPVFNFDEADMPSYVMKEIISTEENFVAGLNTLMNDFLLPLSTVLNDQDRKTICINMSELIKLHSTLYEELKTACKGESSNSVFKICCK
jgi:hypothetical protein